MDIFKEVELEPVKEFNSINYANNSKDIYSDKNWMVIDGMTSKILEFGLSLDEAKRARIQYSSKLKHDYIEIEHDDN